MSARVRRNLIVAAIAMLALLLVGLTGAAEAPAAKKLTACVTKKGPDKGTMRYARRCHKGERKISWNKKGKAGPAGQAGATGPQGPSGLTDELLQTIATQQSTIETLQTQLSDVTSQLDAVKSQLNGLSPQVAALCTQMPAVTSQANALRTVINGITAVGLVVPALPAPLSAFSC